MNKQLRSISLVIVSMTLLASSEISIQAEDDDAVFDEISTVITNGRKSINSLFVRTKISEEKYCGWEDLQEIAGSIVLREGVIEFAYKNEKRYKFVDFLVDSKDGVKKTIAPNADPKIVESFEKIRNDNPELKSVKEDGRYVQQEIQIFDGENVSIITPTKGGGAKSFGSVMPKTGFKDLNPSSIEFMIFSYIGWYIPDPLGNQQNDTALRTHSLPGLFETYDYEILEVGPTVILRRAFSVEDKEFYDELTLDADHGMMLRSRRIINNSGGGKETSTISCIGQQKVNDFVWFPNSIEINIYDHNSAEDHDPRLIMKTKYELTDVKINDVEDGIFDADFGSGVIVDFAEAKVRGEASPVMRRVAASQGEIDSSLNKIPSRETPWKLLILINLIVFLIVFALWMRRRTVRLE